MGVDRTDYLMFGANVGYDAFSWEKHEAEAEGRPERRFDVVLDGMCGKYCMAGKIIKVSGPTDGGFEACRVDAQIEALEAEKVCREVMSAFPHWAVTRDDFGFYLFSHYS